MDVAIVDRLPADEMPQASGFASDRWYRKITLW